MCVCVSLYRLDQLAVNVEWKWWEMGPSKPYACPFFFSHWSGVHVLRERA